MQKNPKQSSKSLSRSPPIAAIRGGDGAFSPSPLTVGTSSVVTGGTLESRVKENNAIREQGAAANCETGDSGNGDSEWAET